MRVFLCALLAGLASILAIGADMPESRAVYLLPMSGGLDQYLANRLNSSQVFRVVTDPKLADAVFTDQLGEAFELKLAALFTPPEDADKDDSKAQPHGSGFSRGKGTVFLVDLKSRAVLWSGYERPNGSTPAVLDRTASHIVQQIKKQQKGTVTK